MKKEEVFIDLRRCSDEHVKHLITKIFSSDFPIATLTRHILENMMVRRFNGTPYLLINEFDHWKLNKTDMGKTELTYPEFIRLFEGGEGENELEVWLNRQIEKCQQLDMPREEWAFIQVLKKTNSK